jgi:hypothetical protein
MKVGTITDRGKWMDKTVDAIHEIGGAKSSHMRSPEMLGPRILQHSLIRSSESHLFNSAYVFYTKTHLILLFRLIYFPV